MEYRDLEDLVRDTYRQLNYLQDNCIDRQKFEDEVREHINIVRGRQIERDKEMKKLEIGLKALGVLLGIFSVAFSIITFLLSR